MKKFALFIFLSCFLVSCSKNDLEPQDNTPVEMVGLSFNSGKNDYNESFTESNRQFSIHVPITYEVEDGTALVFAFHDQDSSPDTYYEESAWVQKADAENFVVVFPQARNYFISDIGQSVSFWAEFEADLRIQEGTEIQDDVLFVEELLELLEETFNILENEIYLTGHGQGGDFVKSILMTNLDDIIAASAVTGSLGVNEFLVHANRIYNPLMAILGNQDEIELAKAGRTEPFPTDASGIMADLYLSEIIDNMVISLQLNPFGIVNEMAGYTQLIYDNSSVNQDTEFIAYIIEGLGREEAKPDNHTAGLSAVDLYWDFFQKHKK